MGTLATVRVNTTQKMIQYRGFTIQESTEGWEWAHWDCDYAPTGPNGTCQTMFECVDAVDAWYEQKEAA